MTANSKTDFYQSSQDEQIERLAQLTHKALAHWDLADADVSPVAYRENMTFSVDAGDKGRFAFRVHQADYRTDSHIQSELDFMQELNANGIATPQVVLAKSGASFVTATHEGVPEPRQCDLFEWIEGEPIRKMNENTLSEGRLVSVYQEVGRQCAAIHNVAERWQRPGAFERPAWDAEGIFGPKCLLGDFRKLQGTTEQQRQMLLDVAAKLEQDLEAFGKAPDRYGLSHGDFLPENIFVHGDQLRMLDFDDAGDSWYLFDFATALFDMMDDPAFDVCLSAMIEGYRENRALPDEHLAMLPAFILARVLSYLGWCAKKTHMEQSEAAKQILLGAIDSLAPAYLAG